MKDEPGVAGLASSMLEPRFIGFFCFLMISFLVALYGYGNLVARRRTGALRGRPPRRAARHLLIYMVRAVMQGLVRLIRQPAAAAAPDAIAPTPLLQSQLSTTQEKLQPNQSTIEEELQSNQSTIEEELQSQLSASKEDFQPLVLATQEELQSAVEEDLQPQRIEIREELWPPAEDELHPQQSALEGCSEVAILQNFLVINIWNGGSLKQCLRNLMACFKKINYPIQFTTAHSPNGSSSSPCHFEYTYGAASVNKNNNDRHNQFKSLLLLDQGGIYLIDYSSLIQFGDMIHKQSGTSGYKQILHDVFEDNSYVLDRYAESASF